LLGVHNVRNILATIAVAADVGVDTAAIIAGVRAFRGVKRRMELRGEAQGVRVYDDFAHHPTAIRETLAGVRAAHPASRIWGIFEPRSATSCRRVFQDEFSTAFDSVDEAILAAVFRANLPDDQRLSGEAVVAGINARGTRARLIPTVPEIVTSVAAEARAGDLVVIMSNGGFEGIHDKLLAALGARVAG
jgi:UDP-N-acetylmuramate: L-alanyl-gamma-D-glutamyl-meso-diaminopimelate ligase